VASPTDLAAEILAHGVVAALVVQVVIRRVPVRAPVARLAFRTCVLVLPLVLPFMLRWLAPCRGTEAFTDLALFSTARWNRLAIAGVGLRDLGLLVAALLGIVLLVPDLLHLLAARRLDLRAERTPLPADHPVVTAFTALVDDTVPVMGAPPTRVDIVETPARLLHCHGAWRPAIVASRGVVDGLPRDQLRAAVVHEVAHIARHDVLRGWVLLVLRLVQWFNPVAQLFGRRAAQEMEWEADRVAATVTGTPLALARALIWSVRGRDAQFLGVLGRGRASIIEERCRRLLDYDPDTDAVAPRMAPAMTGLVAALATLLFFVI